jgi:hypothetical protein
VVAFLDPPSGYFYLHVPLIEAQTNVLAFFGGVQMKLSAAAIIFFSSITISFAGNFTPVPKNKIAQSGCSTACQNLFNVCLQVCGGNCLSTSPNKPAVGRNCDIEELLCLQNCPKGT